MNLGKYFTYAELTNTGTRAINRPDNGQLVSLTRLVALCLDPLRRDCGSLVVTSGFRSAIVNKNVGGSPTSFHTHGLAADFHSDDLHVTELVDRVEFLALPFDKLIMEYGDNSTWLHWQIVEPNRTNRGEIYTANMVDGSMEYTKVN